MDGSRFDTLVKTLATTPVPRATVLRGLAASAVALVGVTLGPASEEAAGKKLGKVKRVKICNCANERASSCNQIKVIKKKAKKHLRRNECSYRGGCTGVSGCAGVTCSDGIKNGSETDVDCGGGSCPRCATGKTCATRNDCASALCVGTTCQVCDQPTECGTDSDGQPCACRDHESGQRFCTKPDGRFFPAGTSCGACQGAEQCFPINGGAGGIECILPCGA